MTKLVKSFKDELIVNFTEIWWNLGMKNIFNPKFIIKSVL